MTNRILQWLSSILETGRNSGIFSFKGDSRNRALLILSNMIASLQLTRVLDKTEFKGIHQTLLDDLKG